MTSRIAPLLFLLSLTLAGGRSATAGEFVAREVRASASADHAVVRVNANARSSHSIPRDITGKFAEHLGFNIYHGMDAQIVFNPTFADYPFWNGQMTPDGITEFRTRDSRIGDELRGLARRFGWPDADLDNLIQARDDALAAFWMRVGPREAVEVSPDTAPSGARAQRVQFKASGQGLAQWMWLPLHRVRSFRLEILARSPGLTTLTVTLTGRDGKEAARAQLTGLSSTWGKVRGTLTVPADEPNDAAYKLSVLADGPGQLVLGHLFLLPSDSVRGADPDIVRFLRESHLPLLRWPGGNFASTYHWEDGIGPVDDRVTKPNLAWGGIEPNTFGTDEFITFCQSVGCEPMICVNAGSGTPEEAARWIEYCNGSANSPMGQLRAANGHPAPYGIKRWEVGNELWGHWQMGWTTAPGYVDRYLRFAKAMLAADSNITLYACGAPAMSGKQWNDTLIHELGARMQRITDHPLIGGGVVPSAEPLDVFRDFMAVPEVLQGKWAALRDGMRAGGIADPKLAVTELQLFAHIARATDTNAPVRLTREHLPSQGSITEALYDILVYHAAIRLDPFVELITHSAIVNHGGGLRKEHEHVWANPCYYAQADFANFGGATPVATEIETTAETAPMVLPDLRHAAPSASFGAVDALGALAPDGSLLVSIVSRRSAPEPLHLQLALDGFQASGPAQVRTLTAHAPWEGNSLEQPDAVKPVESAIASSGGKFEWDLPAFSVVFVRVPGTSRR